MKTPLHIAILALLLATSATAGAATKTWTGAIDNTWHEPGNWSPPGVPAGNATINMGNAYVSATLPVTIASGGSLNWSTVGLSAAFYGGLTIASGGELNVAGDALTIDGLVTNFGIIRWSGNRYLYLQRLDNRPGALFDIQTDQTYGGVSILNAGQFRKSAGSGTTPVFAPFTNTTGTVQALSGTISLRGGGPFEGNFHAAAGAAIQLEVGDFTYSTPPTLMGPGDFRMDGGATLTLVNNPIPGLQMISGTVMLSPVFQGGTITNLNLGGVTLSGNYTVSGTLNANGGTMQGDLNVATGGVVNWTGATMSGYHTIASGGTLNWTGGIYCYLFGGLTIANGGVFNVGIEGRLSFEGGVTNAGTFRWTNGFIGLSDSSDGIFNQPGGLIDVQCDYWITGNPPLLNAGTLHKSASSGTTYIRVPVTNITGTVQAHIGTLQFDSAFHQSPAATLAISIGGPAPGDDYGHLRFTQPLALNSTFTATNRNGYLPNPGDTFNVLSYPSITGDFTCLGGISLGGGIVLFPAVFPKTMTLTAASVAPNAPSLFATRIPGGVRLLRPPGFSDWDFVTTTNLFAPVWTSVPSTGCDQVTLPATAPEQYFRLRKNN
jgi:hypothetical protein